MNWQTDILGEKFQQLKITLNDDYNGKAEATLIRLLSTEQDSQKSILYIHGFNDYFFQKEMAEEFVDNGYNFFALDLRRYGRSYLKHQRFNDVRNLKSYYEEINKAIDIIKKNNNQVYLMGHSTGGLIITLYAKDYTGSNIFDGIILNSPFYDFNISPFIKAFIPLVSFLGKYLPNLTISNVLDEAYGESLHKDYSGEWDYKLAWKPNLPPPVTFGWIRAIYQGQRTLKLKYYIQEPVLILHSTQSSSDRKDASQLFNTDVVLSVKDIKRVAQHIVGKVEITAIEGGIHDLVLSRKAVREKVYSTILTWLHSL